MLNEMALTPQVFEQASHPDLRRWRRELTALGRKLLPDYGPTPFIVSDLDDGNWFYQLRTFVEGIEDQGLRIKAQNLLRVVQKLKVTRPNCGHRPYDEQEWLEEAWESAKQEPIWQIFTSGRPQPDEGKEEHRCASLADVGMPSVWHGVETSRFVRMSLDEQVATLRPICLHAGHLAIALPYLVNSEFPFGRAVIESALERPPKYGAIRIDLHTVASDCADHSGAEDMARGLEQRLPVVASKCQRLRLIVWPKFLDREILAGDVVASKEHPDGFRPRWGVSLTHPARRFESESGDCSFFSLYTRTQLNVRYRRFYGDIGDVAPLWRPVELFRRR